MSLKNQRRLAAQILKCSPHRIKFDSEKLGEIEEAITKADLRGLISQGIVTRTPETGISRGRARETAKKKKRGQRKGHGSRKGKKFARAEGKREWINKIRSQRRLLLRLKTRGEIDRRTFRGLYMKAKGGFFRNVRHIKLYMEENKLMRKIQS